MAYPADQFTALIRQITSLVEKMQLHEIIPAEEGGFVGLVPELLGCITQGETLEETLQMINDAKRAWLETAIGEGIEIPKPDTAKPEEGFSGKFVVRVPKTLHRDLARKAKEENVSLNQLTTYLLAAGVSKPVHNAHNG